MVVGSVPECRPRRKQAVNYTSLDCVNDHHQDGKTLRTAPHSTDGDSDRPLLIGLAYTTDGRCEARFYGGDLVGVLVATRLRPDAIAEEFRIYAVADTQLRADAIVQAATRSPDGILKRLQNEV